MYLTECKLLKLERVRSFVFIVLCLICCLIVEILSLFIGCKLAESAILRSATLPTHLLFEFALLWITGISTTEFYNIYFVAYKLMQLKFVIPTS
jgi:hypothetical protein